MSLLTLCWLLLQLDLRALFEPPEGDFLTYWAAGKLHLDGQNPYDPELMSAALRTALGAPTTEPVTLPPLVYNPPWVFPFLIVIAAAGYFYGRLLWLGGAMVCLLIVGDYAWRLYGGEPRQRWWGWLLVFSFAPALVALRIGQITPFVVGGVVLFLVSVKRGNWATAGAAAALIALKPQLLYLFWPVFLLWILVTRRWPVLLGFVAALLAGTAAAMLTNPAILPQFIAMVLYNPPAQYTPPTWGTALRLLTGREEFWLQFVPVLLGLLWLGLYWRHHRHEWQWLAAMPWLLLISMATSPYGWSYDMVILLPALIQVAVRLGRNGRHGEVGLIVCGYLLLNGLIFYLRFIQVYDFWLFWAPTALLLLYWLSRLRLMPGSDGYGPNGRKA